MTTKKREPQPREGDHSSTSLPPNARLGSDAGNARSSVDAEDATHIRRREAFLAESAPCHLVSGLVGRLLMFWHLDGIPSDAAWSDVLERLRAAGTETRVLVLTDGGRPSLPQQARLRQVLAARRAGLRVAVLSDDVHVRFVASTLALLTKHLRTFSSGDVEGALSHLELSDIERHAAQQLIRRRDAERLRLASTPAR